MKKSEKIKVAWNQENLYILKKYISVRMRPSHIILTASLLFLMLSSASALPNIKVNWVQYNLESGRIVAEIYNDSEEIATEFLVDFYVDGELYSTYSAETPITLNPKSAINVFSDFLFDEKGHHFFVIADPDNAVNESNEEDNTASEKLDLGGEDQDLGPDDSHVQDEINRFYNTIFTGLAGLLVFFAVLYILVKVVKKRYA